MKLSRLRNGLKIATLQSNSHFVTTGIYIQAGSRNENERTRGSTQILEKLTFKATKNLSKSELVEKVEKMGSQFQTITGKETIMYQSMIFEKDLRENIKLLSEMVRYPRLDPQDLQEAIQDAKFQNLDSKWDLLKTLPDKLHQLAYRSSASLGKVSRIDPKDVNTLGQSLQIHEDFVDGYNLLNLLEFRDTFYTPCRMVVVGVGVDHEKLVSLAEEYMGDMEPASKSIQKAQSDASLPAKYTGAIGILDTSLMEKSPNPDDMILTSVLLGFEGMGMDDPDIVAMNVLGTLLGGGGSFSAGGPGKGMYTRLYTQVLNRNGWIENCNVFNHTYTDSSLFGISISVPSDKSTHHHVLNVLCDQILLCTTTCGDEELSRAKNMLKSSLMMALESQLVQAEDMGRQVLKNGKRMTIEEVCRRIDMVKTEDIIRVGQRIFMGKDIPSRFEFEDSKHWKATGPWNPTLLIEGPLTGPKDTLFKAEEILAKWGLSRGISRGRKSFFL